MPTNPSLHSLKRTLRLYKIGPRLAPNPEMKIFNSKHLECSRAMSMRVFPKIMVTPKSSILIGFSIIFTIHFGGKIPLFFGNIHVSFRAMGNPQTPKPRSPKSQPSMQWGKSLAMPRWRRQIPTTGQPRPPEKTWHQQVTGGGLPGKSN